MHVLKPMYRLIGRKQFKAMYEICEIILIKAREFIHTGGHY